MKFKMLTTIQNKSDRVLKATAKAKRRWLFRVGGYISRIAKNSLRRARRMRSEDEMSDEQLDRWLILNRRRERRGLEWLDLPDRVSKPEKPPLLHMRPSPLKFLLRFAVDEHAGDVAIGPEKARSGIVHDLEYGTTTIAPRPFMRPAQQKALPRVTTWWQDAIT